MPDRLPANGEGDVSNQGEVMTQTVLTSLNQSLHEMMDGDPRVLMMGEDLLDPYGGAFKVTKGLSERFPERVWTTPISEAGFVGVASGMAMRGLRPVVEIMFGDFLLLAADQLVNHAAKFRWMYGDKVDVPLVVRAPMGGYRGYGPTHSQTLEKHFLGVPGLAVVAIDHLTNPGQMLKKAVIDDDRPVVFIENKGMYARRLQPPVNGRIGAMLARQSDGFYPTTTLSFADVPSGDVTIVAYGGMVQMAIDAAETLLIEDEIYAEVCAPTCLHPMDTGPIAESIRRTGRLVVCEEASPQAGFGAEVISRICDEHFEALEAAPLRVGARPMPIANAKSMEEAILPGVDDIVEAVRSNAGRWRTSRSA